MDTAAEVSVWRTWSEDDLLREVRRLALVFRWRLYHTRYSLRSTAGFPDLVLVRPPRVLVAELKRQGGKLTEGGLRHDKRGYPRWVDGQEQWLAALAHCPGVETYVWYPADLKDVATILDTGPTPGMPSRARVEELLRDEDH